MLRDGLRCFLNCFYEALNETVRHSEDTLKDSAKMLPRCFQDASWFFDPVNANSMLQAAFQILLNFSIGDCWPTQSTD